jgi:hypothetical protein
MPSDRDNNEERAIRVEMMMRGHAAKVVRVRVLSRRQDDRMQVAANEAKVPLDDGPHLSVTLPRAFAHRREQHGTAALTMSSDCFAITTPAVSPPAVVCPSCDRPLRYNYSHFGGDIVSYRHPEQWHYYVCPASCGAFQYRQRTHKLRRVS